MKIILLLIFIIELQTAGIASFFSNDFDVLIKKNKFDEAERYVDSHISNINEKIEYYHQLSKIYFDKKNFNKAKYIFIKITFLNPDDFFSHYYLGIIFLKENNYNKAIIEFNKCLKLDSKFFRTYLHLGKIYFQAGDYLNAEKHFVQGEFLSNNNPELILELINFYYAINNFDKYIKYSLKYINLKSVNENNKFQIIYNLLEYYNKSLNYQKAVETYISLPDNFKENTKIKLLISKIYYQLENFADAKQLLHSIQNDSSSEPVKNYLLANIYFREKKYSEAIKYYETYFKNNPADMDSLSNIILSYREVKDMQNYNLYFKFLLEKYNPDFIPVKMILDNIKWLLNNKKYDFLDECFAICDNILNKNIDYIKLKLKFYRETFSSDELKLLYNSIIEDDMLRPQFAKDYFKYLNSIGNFNSAEIFYKNNNIQLYESEINEINLLRGYRYYVENKFDSALYYFNNYILKNPNTNDINYFISTIYKYKNDFVNEKKYLESEFKNNPYNSANLERIININIKSGNIKNAEYYCFCALKIDDDYMFAKKILKENNLYDSDSKIASAIELFKAPDEIKLNKNYFAKTYQYGLQKIKNKNYSEALVNLYKTYYIPPDKYSEYYFYKGICYLNSNNYIFAYIFFSLSEMSKKTIPVLYNLALINNYMGDYKVAYNKLNELKSIVKEKEWVDLNILEGTILFNLKEYNKSMMIFLNLKKYDIPEVDYYLYNINLILGDNMYNDGNYKYALTYYENCLKFNINNQLLFFCLGNCYYRLGDYENAKSNYEKALYFNLQNDALYTNLGLTYSNLNDTNKSNEFFNKTKNKITVKDETDYIQKFKTLLNNKNYNQAEKLIRTIPDKNEKIMFELFLNYLKGNEINSKYFDEIESTKLKCTEFYDFINAQLQYKKRNYDKSISLAKSACNKSAYSAFFIIELAKLFAKTNHIENGISYFKSEIENNYIEDKNLLFLLLGNLYFIKTDYINAIEYYNKILDENSDNARQNLIIALYKSNKLDDALFELNKLSKNNKFKHLMRALLYKSKGLHNLSESEYQKGIQGSDNE